MPVSKRGILAAASRYLGITHLLRYAPSRTLLLVLTYHRIGDSDATPYDPGVFSATADEFDEQIRFLKKRFHIATLEEAIQIALNKTVPTQATVLLTFDDGYIDNYLAAYPILASHGVQAVFFLTTSFVGSARIPWWDSAAYIVKNSRNSAFRFAGRSFDLATGGTATAIGDVLAAAKHSGYADAETFLSELEEACAASRPDGSQRCFLNWTEAAEMLRGGMAIGSHTHTHPILAALPEQEQLRELSTSRSLLERKLGQSIRSIAYPYGLRDSASPATFAAAESAGYSVGFSFYGGLNRPGAIDRYNIAREGVNPLGQSRFQMGASLAAVSGRFFG